MLNFSTNFVTLQFYFTIFSLKKSLPIVKNYIKAVSSFDLGHLFMLTIGWNSACNFKTFKFVISNPTNLIYVYVYIEKIFLKGKKAFIPPSQTQL